ncbi:MAG: 16S rRNA (adenine(1518)-N(6)/adenine(1519)-N(6))-dimethyltransferase RsmA [Desulfobacteraceae bacterium]|nr:16S rRNA (adenine(1518)-N(6)/adenine(1519)-N(6))-dimethyltransferase RsmA [Desulfobacteraceae bacterium]MDH3571996.1 16S rRNA (adenine(1518)-N(6)/adenine(1519)-N(6))-dimethyltransferase RsmA [Desulfobacteraceae bacterium]MDH3720480.1 16S rRNA (adenine(1518)-N(6)/adenine(1519)-N(6))-dimethyltransferase RsmA [Desulfobacteraceae bacterium]MDH3835629.1 16S rRNA (adenine(1518)-N(6)/adenine(1519)-N(6))-dimethyltransferase RsmA [Desulfobacteraceae bacterium]MDH3872960.1 16S rRNA (adenine(1518)-N(6)
MTSPKILLAAHNIHPKKQLGQNFIVNPAFTEMIVKRAGISSEDIILEIGAGLGALTIPLARRAKKVFAVEKDRQIIPILNMEILVSGLTNISIIEEDILSVDITALVEDMGGKIVVMGNLPYNISSQILVQLIRSREGISRAVLMFQKELAQRITAETGCKDYGRLTVMLRYCSDIKKLVDAKASLFFPKPKVDSQILELKFKKEIDHKASDEPFLFKVIKAGFGNRRKTLKNALAASELNIDPITAKGVLEKSGIDPIRRAETLTVEEFVKLSNNLLPISVL